MHFSAIGVNDMLEAKFYSFVDIVIPIIAAFIERWIGFQVEQKLTIVHSIFSDLVNYSMSYPCDVIASSVYGYDLKKNS